MKCEYCGTVSDKGRCPSCGAPRKLDMLLVCPAGMTQAEVNAMIEEIEEHKRKDPASFPIFHLSYVGKAPSFRARDRLTDLELPGDR